jgi:hypothetical protein
VIQFTSSIDWRRDFESDMDRALDPAGSMARREDEIIALSTTFVVQLVTLKSRVGNGRDLNRSMNEAERVLQLADQVDRYGARRLDSRTSSEWSQIQSELRTISDVYGLNYRGDYNRGRNGNGNNRTNDWLRRIPFPR